jgi:hypothetical protein
MHFKNSLDAESNDGVLDTSNANITLSKQLVIISI